MPHDLHPVPSAPSSVAAVGPLARYRVPTLSAYRNELALLLDLVRPARPPTAAGQRAHLELYLRGLHVKGYVPPTTSRRLSTVAGLFRYALIDEVVAKHPALAVARPEAQWEGQRRAVLHPLELAAVLTAARR